MTKTLPEQLRALERLQELDLKILNLMQKKESLPDGLKDLDAKLAEFRKVVAAKSLDKESLEKNMRQAQAALELNQDRVTRATAKLENVANQQEFHAATKELEQLKKSNEELEKQKQELQSGIEAIEKELAAILEEAGKVQAEHDTRCKVISGEVSQLDAALGELNRERDSRKSDVKPPILSRYDRLRKARAGLGLVPASGGRCTGCNMHLPPQLFNMIQRADELQNCPSCHRILFLPSEKGNE